MAEKSLTTADHVHEAFLNALENGYDFLGWTDDAIAVDMMDCDGYINENCVYEDVLVEVAKYRRAQGINDQGVYTGG